MNWYAEGSKFDITLKRWVLFFLAVVMISAVIGWFLCGLVCANPIFIILYVFLLFALDMVLFTILGLAYLIDTYMHQAATLAKDRRSCALWQMTVIYCLGAFRVVLVFFFAVLLPASFIVCIVWQALDMLGWSLSQAGIIVQ